MATIVLVCAAGVSGTFLARRIAPSLPEVDFIVATEHSLDDVLPTADAVLLAPHLGSSVDDIRLRVAPRPVGILSPEAMTPAGSILAVDAIDALIQTVNETALQRSTEDV